MKKNLFMGGVAIVIVAIVYFAFLYPWPSAPESVGTIGSVQKYKSDQINQQDIALLNQDVSMLLQNDKVLDLVKYPQFRALAKDPSFAQLAKMPELAQLAKMPEFAQLAQLPALYQLAKLPEFSQLAKMPEFAQLAKLPEFSQLAKLPEFSQLAKIPEFYQLIKPVINKGLAQPFASQPKLDWVPRPCRSAFWKDRPGQRKFARVKHEVRGRRFLRGLH